MDIATYLPSCIIIWLPIYTHCSGDVILGLLFVDDTSLFATDGPGIKKSLDVRVRWCNEWGVKIDVQKSAIMHIRQKS